MKTLKDSEENKQNRGSNVRDYGKGEKGCYVRNLGTAPLSSDIWAETWMMRQSQPCEMGGRGIHKTENHKCKRPPD